MRLAAGKNKFRGPKLMVVIPKARVFSSGPRDLPRQHLAGDPSLRLKGGSARDDSDATIQTDPSPFDFPYLTHYIRPSVLFVLCNSVRNARLCRSAKTGKRVQIPRCRATVSEDIALGPLGSLPGRPSATSDAIHPHSRARRPARSVYPNLFRVKGRIVCASPLSFF